jgi:hypothetical protein
MKILLIELRALVFVVALAAICSACGSTDIKGSDRQDAGRHAEISPEMMVNERGYDIVGPVKSIKNYRIDGWNYLSSRALIINAGVRESYLLTLRFPCHGLRNSTLIATTSTTSNLTKFESIIVRQAGTGAQKCPIENLYKLEKSQAVTQ